MILTIAIENTNTIVGCFDKETLKFAEAISTDLKRTELEYLIRFQSMLDMYRIAKEDLEGAMISSVVPSVTDTVKYAASRMTGGEALVVGPGVKTGLNILTDQPSQVGSDLVTNAVAGIQKYGAPLIIVNMGTATTLTAINEKKQYVGGMIIPGMKVSLDSLSKGAAQLPDIGLKNPKKVIGANTVECMRSGMIYGTAAMVEGCLKRMEEEMGYNDVTVVATGEYAKHILPYCGRKMIYDENLLFDGLRLIYEKNRTTKS